MPVTAEISTRVEPSGCIAELADKDELDSPVGPLPIADFFAASEFGHNLWRQNPIVGGVAT